MQGEKRGKIEIKKPAALWATGRTTELVTRVDLQPPRHLQELLLVGVGFQFFQASIHLVPFHQERVVLVDVELVRVGRRELRRFFFRKPFMEQAEWFGGPSQHQACESRCVDYKPKSEDGNVPHHPQRPYEGHDFRVVVAVFVEVGHQRHVHTIIEIFLLSNLVHHVCCRKTEKPGNRPALFLPCPPRQAAPPVAGVEVADDSQGDPKCKHLRSLSRTQVGPYLGRKPLKYGPAWGNCKEPD